MNRKSFFRDSESGFETLRIFSLHVGVSINLFWSLRKVWIYCDYYFLGFLNFQHSTVEYSTGDNVILSFELYGKTFNQTSFKYSTTKYGNTITKYFTFLKIKIFFLLLYLRKKLFQVKVFSKIWMLGKFIWLS